MGKPLNLLSVEKPQTAGLVPPVYEDPAPDTFATSPMILLVEGGPLAQKLHRRSLEKLGCQVQRVDNAQAAIDASAKTDYDAMLLDYNLPDKNGDTVIQAIRVREQKTQHYLPIILAATHSTESELAACRAAGSTCVLLKPISIEDLRKALQTCGFDVQGDA